MRTLIALIGLLAATTLAHATPYEGDWIADAKAKCPRSSNAYGENIVAITPTTITFYESSCTIDRADAKGPAAWLLSLSCRGEDGNSRERRPLTLLKNGREMRLNGVTWYRCRR